MTVNTSQSRIKESNAVAFVDDFVEFVRQCYQLHIEFEPDEYSEIFIRSNTQRINDLKILERDFKLLKKTEGNNSIDGNIERAKDIFIHTLEQLNQDNKKLLRRRKANPVTGSVINEGNSRQSIFSGLEYEGNNDSSYSNNPSPYMLSKFRV